MTCRASFAIGIYCSFGVAVPNNIWATGTQDIQSINAVTLATNDMVASFLFYEKLGLNCTFGGSSAPFTTFGASGGPSGVDSSFHINIFVSDNYTKPVRDTWNRWGRAIFYVSDVDNFYHYISRRGLKPEAAPMNASWGERFFHMLDPMGHELAFAKPLLRTSFLEDSLSSRSRTQGLVQTINAVTFATNDMVASCTFYRNLGLNITFGGPSARFSTFGSQGGPAGGDNSFHINIFVSADYERPAKGKWNGWGRAIFYVTNVDNFYHRAVMHGVVTEAAPQDAPWGERFFQVLDPMGHELSFATPLHSVMRVEGLSDMSIVHV